MRAIGTVVLIAGVLAAVTVYLVALRGLEPAPFDPLEGHSRSADRQVQALMGNWVNLTAGWSEALTSPLGEAVGVGAFSALVAGYFFRVASIVDAEQADSTADSSDARSRPA